MSFQDAFVTVWRKRHRYEHPRPFRPWLYAIAVNLCRTAHCSRPPSASPLSDDHCGDGPAPDSALSSSETARLIGRALAQLPPQQRAVVSLRVWEEMPYARIAEVVGCTEGTVRAHMHHGLASLREVLAPLIRTGAITPE